MKCSQIARSKYRKAVVYNAGSLHFNLRQQLPPTAKKGYLSVISVEFSVYFPLVLLTFTIRNII